MDDGVARGHVKIARKTFTNDPWWLEHREFSRWEAWVFVIQLASFKTYLHATEHGVIPLERGEFVASLRWLADQWGWTVKRVRNWLATAKKGARLRAQRETQAGIVYLIVNYDHYQTPGHSKGTQEGTANGTAGAQQGHKREAVNTGKAVKSGARNGDRPEFVTRLVHLWTDEVGAVKPDTVARDAKRAVERHGIDAVEHAAHGYIAQQTTRGKTCKWQWFVEEIEVWIARTAEAPAVVDGEMNTALELMTRP